MTDIVLKSLVRYKILKNSDEYENFLENYKGEKRDFLKEHLAEILAITTQKMEISLLKELLLDKIKLLNIDMSPKEIEILYQIMAKKSLSVIARKLNKKIAFSFDNIDKEAIDAMRKSFYWMGREFNENLRKKLTALIEKTFSGEIANDKIPKILKDEFGGLVKANESYFKGVAEHISLQSQNISRVMQGRKYGVKYYKVVAVMDDRTSEICRSMNGRIIPAAHLEDQADKILSARNMADKKAAAAWRNNAYNGRSDKMDANFGLPPYHFRCRTKVVPVWIDEEEIDGVMMRNTSPLRDDEIIRHIDKTGVERVVSTKRWEHITNRHSDVSKNDIIKAMNSITEVGKNESIQNRTNTFSSNGIFMVFEGDKLITAYRPNEQKKKSYEYFKNSILKENKEVIKWSLGNLI